MEDGRDREREGECRAKEEEGKGKRIRKCGRVDGEMDDEK
jgi:hypothetical protein